MEIERKLVAGRWTLKHEPVNWIVDLSNKCQSDTGVTKIVNITDLEKSRLSDLITWLKN